MDGDDDSSASAATTASRLGVSAAAQRREQHRLEGEGVTYQQRCDMRAQMRAELRQQQLPSVMVQQIICYYFQRQQRLYFVNHANANNEDIAAPNIDVADFEYNSDDMPGDEQGPHADGSHADAACAEGDEEYVLSEYELERIERIRQHTAVLAGLGLRR